MHGPPANIPPLQLELTDDANPICVKIRKYSESQRCFLRKLTDKLVAAGMIYPNPNSKWASAPQLVHKPGPDEWRFTLDLRAVNRFTVPQRLIMPVVQQELSKAKDARQYAEVDMVHS